MIDRGLVIASPWIEKILVGKKCWEIKGQTNSRTGRIALAKKGGPLVATADIERSKVLPAEDIEKTYALHRATRADIYKIYGQRSHYYAWPLSDVRRLDPPIQYRHPGGGAIVTLSSKNVAEFDRLQSSGEPDPVVRPARRASEKSMATPPMKSVPGQSGPAPTPSLSNSFNPQTASERISRGLNLAPEELKHSFRWHVSRSVGLGVDSRGRGRVLAFTGMLVSLRGSGLQVEQVQTGKPPAKYGTHNNMAKVAGCEPGKLIQRVTLRSFEDVELLVQAVLKAAGR